MRRTLVLAIDLAFSAVCSIASSGVAFAGAPPALLQFRQFPRVELVAGELAGEACQNVPGRRPILVAQILHGQQ